MKSGEPKKDGALPAGELNRLAQRDIGKVARLFRESGFRYRVFDAETGEHQMVDPVRPLPPLDHVPPVWPPPLDAEERVPRAAGAAVARATEVAPARVEIRATAATARAEEIFRSVADGSALPAATAAAPRPTAAPAPPAGAPAPAATRRHVSAPAAATAPPVRVEAPAPVSVPSRMELGAPVSAVFDAGLVPLAAELEVEPTVGAVFDRLFQAPPTPARRDTDSTANVLGGLLGKFPER